MSVTIGGPRDVLRRFLAGEDVTPFQMLRDKSPWDWCFEGTPEQSARWDALIAAMNHMSRADR